MLSLSLSYSATFHFHQRKTNCTKISKSSQMLHFSLLLFLLLVFPFYLSLSLSLIFSDRFISLLRLLLVFPLWFNVTRGSWSFLHGRFYSYAPVHPHWHGDSANYTSMEVGYDYVFYVRQPLPNHFLLYCWGVHISGVKEGFIAYCTDQASRHIPSWK